MEAAQDNKNNTCHIYLSYFAVSITIFLFNFDKSKKPVNNRFIFKNVEENFPRIPHNIPG
jgi:hypothetical protein